MIFTALNVYLWAMAQYTSYNDVIRQGNQFDIDRLTERLDAVAEFSVEGDTVVINATVKNLCPLTIRIIRVWVVDATLHQANHAALDVNLAAGQTATVVANVTITGTSIVDDFSSWLVTERGNAFPCPQKELGPLLLNFDAFRYFEYESATKLKNYPNGNAGFIVPAKRYIAFGCSLTNLDPEKRTIVFDSYSMLWTIVPSSDIPHSRWWYIVNVAQDGTINATYSSISLAYGETKMIIFASASDLGSSGFSRQTTFEAGLPAVVFLLLHGQIGGSAYVRNLPFASLYFS
jgi:hypothetical protein